MFGKHPSRELQGLFKEKPYQGQEPEKARVIIFGSDANYNEKLSDNHCFFKRIIEYHLDGIKFWNNYKKHHPFLLDDYPLAKNKGGVPYHRNFAKMELLPEKYAEYISFVELLNVPTTGSTQRKLFWELFYEKSNQDHVKWLDSVITEKTDSKKLILLCDSVIKIMKVKKVKNTLRAFSWVQDSYVQCSSDDCGIISLNTQENRTTLHNDVHKINHFSSPGIHRQIGGIKILIKSHCSSDS